MDWRPLSPPATHSPCRPQIASSEIHPPPRLSLPSQLQVTHKMISVLTRSTAGLSIKSLRLPRLKLQMSPSPRWTRRSTSLNSSTSPFKWIYLCQLVPSSRLPSQLRFLSTMTQPNCSWLGPQVNHLCFRVPLCRLPTRWPRRSRCLIWCPRM